MAGFLVLSSLVLGGTQAVADLPLIIPQMTIKIYNNSGDSNIYPVISFPGGPLNAIDKWMQGQSAEWLTLSTRSNMVYFVPKSWIDFKSKSFGW